MLQDFIIAEKVRATKTAAQQLAHILFAGNLSGSIPFVEYLY